MTSVLSIFFVAFIRANNLIKIFTIIIESIAMNNKIVLSFILHEIKCVCSNVVFISNNI